MLDDKRVPFNTAREAQETPIAPLASALILGAGASIERQEADGQQSFVGSDTLPTDMGRYGKYDAKAILEAAGVKFLGVVEGDDLFQYVELPVGWKKLSTGHSMWSKLVDDKGRERGSIFYKAAFYDRRAAMNLSTRFNVKRDLEREDKESVAVVHVMDGEEVVFTTEPIALSTERSERNNVAERARTAAIEWLDKNYPDWKNPGAYWD